jgi:inner membrane protein
MSDQEPPIMHAIAADAPRPAAPRHEVTPPALPRAAGGQRGSALPPSIWRLLLLGGLALAALAPLAMIKGVLGERRERRDEAVQGIAATWGAEQQLFGPLLVLPYRRTVQVMKEEVVNGVLQRRAVDETKLFHASFLPEALTVSGRIAPSRRYRGIYEAVVYEADLHVEGRFGKPDFSAWKVADGDVLWEEAELLLGVTDLRGTRQIVRFDWDGQTLATKPVTDAPITGTGLRARLAQGGTGGADAQGARRFVTDLVINGSRALQFAPAGMSNRVELASTWPDPSFHGGYLPVTREVDAAGFRALWEVSYYGRKFPQQWNDESGGDRWLRDRDAWESFFGVSLLSLVDSYRVVERSIKYGLLIVVLTFALFFLMERLAGVRVHPVQYALTTAALCLFYLAFLSLSEFWPVGRAYTGGAALCTIMITLYTRRALGAARRSLMLVVGLAALYGFLYLVLEAQDYSLLIGTAGLFAALSLVMFATRRIEG